MIQRIHSILQSLNWIILRISGSRTARLPLPIFVLERLVLIISKPQDREAALILILLSMVGQTYAYHKFLIIFNKFFFEIFLINMT